MAVKPYRNWDGPIYQACTEISSLSKPPDFILPEEAEARWESLWGAHVAGSTRDATDPRDVADLGRLGWQLACQRGDFSEALARVRRALGHSRVEQLDYITEITLRDLEAGSLLKMCQETEALACCRRILDRQKRYDRLPLAMVRNTIFCFCNEQSREAVASAAMAELVAEILRRWGGMKRAARSIDPGEATFCELTGLLDHTWSDSHWPETPETPERKDE